VLFAAVEKRAASPFLDLSLFTNKLFVAVNLVRMITAFVMFSLLFSAVLYLKAVYDYTPIQTAMLFLSVSVAMILSAVLSGKLIDKMGPYKPLIIGSLIMVIFFAYFATSDNVSFGVVQFVMYFIAGLAFGVMRPGISYIILRVIPEESFGVSNALSSTVLPIGGMIGVAISGWIIASQSTSFLKGLVNASQISLSPTIWQTLLQMSQGIASHSALQGQLPLNASMQLSTMAKQAFLHAYSSLMWLSAGLFLVMLLLLLYTNAKDTDKGKKVVLEPGMAV
jgi:MFS family permease